MIENLTLWLKTSNCVSLKVNLKGIERKCWGLVGGTIGTIYEMKKGDRTVPDLRPQKKTLARLAACHLNDRAP